MCGSTGRRRGSAALLAAAVVAAGVRHAAMVTEAVAVVEEAVAVVGAVGAAVDRWWRRPWLWSGCRLWRWC